MATPAKKTTPTKTPAKKAAAPVKTPPPAAHKAPPAKAPEKRPEPPKAAAEAEPKLTDAETLEAIALDRGWVYSAAPDGFDVVFTKGNPVLGGYEHLRVAFDKAGNVAELEHENLNRPVVVPQKARFSHAMSVLTGE